jgi:hypothetical protein
VADDKFIPDVAHWRAAGTVLVEYGAPAFGDVLVPGPGAGQIKFGAELMNALA